MMRLYILSNVSEKIIKLLITKEDVKLIKNKLIKFVLILN